MIFPFFWESIEMMEFNSLLFSFLRNDDKRKYYVYRLIDPRNFQTFYVGKGTGDRVYQHMKDAAQLLNSKEDEISLKTRLIAEIESAGKEVIPIIHRYHLTEKEAFEIESALIDAYPNLTNIQKGHDYERGAITVSDLLDSLQTEEYVEPDDKYILIKTTPGAIQCNGNLYEATRRSWRAKLEKAQKYKYVLAVVYGIVREVYEVDKWEQYSPERIAFEGKPTKDSIGMLKGKKYLKNTEKKEAQIHFYIRNRYSFEWNWKNCILCE